MNSSEKTGFLCKLILLVTIALSLLFAASANALNNRVGKTVTITLPSDVKLHLLRIPEGSFEMGSPGNETGRSDDEGPVHKVNINYDFYMGQYEVTQAQWQAVMKTKRAKSYGIGPDYPVYYVSWDDCREFIRKINQLDLPGIFRLPSEAEWEYTCRAGSNTRFYFGDALGSEDKCEDCDAGKLPGKRSDYMWYCGNNVRDDGEPGFGAKPVGQKMPNAFGLYDMHGNVWEWCLDEYHANYIGAPTDGSARQSSNTNARVLRGGAYDYHAKYCRSASRCGYTRSRRYTFHGFRLVWLPYKKYSEQWFKSWPAARIGDNMISYQSDIGAWPKNINMEEQSYQGEKFTKNWGTTIDNGATYTQMNFLAKLYYATGEKRFKHSFIKGLDYLLQAQYENGGWPQRYPLAGDYGDLITFNDNAMTGVTQLMSNILQKPDSDIIDAKRRSLVKKSYQKALRCILNCQQLDQNQRLTIWGAQHDPETLQPRSARSYEHPSLCSGESAEIVLFLMSIENPSESVIRSVEYAVKWFDKNKITGITVSRKDDDVIAFKDKKAKPIWARFYEIETAKPIFSGRDGIIKYSLSEIEKERRTGYQWYNRKPQKVLDAYPDWKKSLQK